MASFSLDVHDHIELERSDCVFHENIMALAATLAIATMRAYVVSEDASTAMAASWPQPGPKRRARSKPDEQGGRR